MPLSSIKKYFRDSNRYNAILVLNGIPDGSFIELKKFIELISEKENIEGNLILDSNLFEEFNVKTVPTIVLKNGKKFDIIKGNISIIAALEIFNKNGDLSENARKILANN